LFAGGATTLVAAIGIVAPASAQTGRSCHAAVAVIAPQWPERFAVEDEDRLVWTDGRERVRVHVDSLRIEQAGRWLRYDLDVEPVRARRQRIRFAFLAAVNRSGDAIHAQAAISSRRLNERCSTDIQPALKSTPSSLRR
jgi:hypothetical protein